MDMFLMNNECVWPTLGPNKCFGRILILITVRFFIVLGPTGAAMTAMHLGSEMCTQETAARQLDKIIFSPMSRLLCMPMWQCATASAWIRMVPTLLLSMLHFCSGSGSVVMQSILRCTLNSSTSRSSGLITLMTWSGPRFASEFAG